MRLLSFVNELLCTLDTALHLIANEIVQCATMSLCTTAEVEIQLSIPSKFHIVHQKYVC